MNRTIGALMLAAVFLGPAQGGHYDAAAAQPRGPAREITTHRRPVSGAQRQLGHLFFVTPDGIILGDPINPAFATWLKERARPKRFKVPVRYVVYSHSHFDHAAGGAVFADTATFVAHENMLRNMDGRYPHMPGDMVDRNDNGAIDPDEIDIPTKAAPGICGMGPGFFATIDRNKDGLVPPAELQADIRPSRHRLFGAHAHHARRPHRRSDSSRAESFRRCDGDVFPRRSGWCSPPSSSRMRSSPRTRARCRAPAARSTASAV